MATGAAAAGLGLGGDGAPFAPFSSARMRQRQRLEAKRCFLNFNRVAGLLLEQLRGLYPSDVKLITISSEFAKLIEHGGDPAEEKRRMQRPALAFFREVRKTVTLEDGSSVEYVDLLAAHDDVAFHTGVPVGILAHFGIDSKWAGMNPELREGIWAYVDQLVKNAAQAVLASSKRDDDKNALAKAAVEAVASGGVTTPEALLTDPAVSAAALRFVDGATGGTHGRRPPPK